MYNIPGKGTELTYIDCKKEVTQMVYVYNIQVYDQEYLGKKDTP